MSVIVTGGAMAGEDTSAKLFIRNCMKWGDSRVAMRKKRYGIWNGYTWKDCHEKVKYFSLGLMSLGFARGEKMAILGDNDPEWFWGELGAMAAGGVVTGVFVDCQPSEARYHIDHCDATVVMAKDQEQVDKMLQISDSLPKVKRIIYWETKGLAGYEHPLLMSFDRVVEQGREYEKSHPGAFEESVAKGRPEDLALILYTSGTKGLPKGAMMSYKYLSDLQRMNHECSPSRITDEYLSYILPGWLVEQNMGFLPWLSIGRPLSFPEDTTTVPDNFREIAPTTIMQPSRQWESLASQIRTRVDESGAVKRFVYNMCLPVGYKVADLELKRQRVGWHLRAAHKVADLVAFRPVRDRYGLSRVRSAVTAGAACSPDILKFFRAHGVCLKQAYGMTESGFVCAHRDGDIRPETVGKIPPEVKVRISDDGEILIGTDFIFQGYYKSPEKYREIVRDGWFHTGDAGKIDEQGHLVYYDRLEDMMELADGQKFAPQYIETRLKFSSRIQECIVIGGKGRPYVAALINIAFENVGRWAEKNRIPYTTYVDLSQRDKVADLIGRDVVNLNKSLPKEWQIRKFVLLHKEFDPDDAELTRTRKLRRSAMEERYSDLISAIYRDATDFVVNAEVRYRDGRSATVATPIKVWTTEKVAG